MYDKNKEEQIRYAEFQATQTDEYKETRVRSENRVQGDWQALQYCQDLAADFFAHWAEAEELQSRLDTLREGVWRAMEDADITRVEVPGGIFDRNSRSAAAYCTANDGSVLPVRVQ